MVLSGFQSTLEDSQMVLSGFQMALSGLKSPLDKSWFSVADGKLKIKSEVKKYSEIFLHVARTKLKILEFEIYCDQPKAKLPGLQ